MFPQVLVSMRPHTSQEVPTWISNRDYSYVRNLVGTKKLELIEEMTYHMQWFIVMMSLKEANYGDIIALTIL